MFTKSSRMNERRWPNGRGERGALTIFTAVLVLILMTLLLVYATRVSLFETRVSANEVRQKQAFNVAEAVVDQGVMYLLSNTSRILSNRENAFSDGLGGSTGDGWFAAVNVRWGTCTSTEIASPTHPCGGDIPAPVGSFFYDDPTTNTGIDSLPYNEIGFPTGSTARLSALMCFVDINNAGAGVCGDAPATADDEPGAALVLTLLAYGYSDCTDTTDVTTCSGRATVAKPVSAYKKLAGTPSVPLVTKSAFPPNGTAEVVGNPNGGGVGVPLTVWANSNPLCSPLNPVISSGSWQTCEMEEWYHVSEQPDGVACTDNNCLCGPGGNDTDYFLSWQTAQETHIGIDIVVDPNFPCDLFETFFGLPRNLYEIIKDSAQQVLPDCSSLGPQSSGLIWISGSECSLTANTVVGSPTAPIILISAASHTKLAGGVQIFGILYVFDGEDIDADITTLGTATIYGAAVMDATMSKFQGNFQVVYNDEVIASANGIGGLGSVNGGWRDFGLPEIVWP